MANINETIVPDPNLYEYEAAGSYDIDDWQSETTSIGSSMYRGLEENGRKYQTLKATESFTPSDEKQFESYEAGHITALVMEADRENPLFRAPIKNPKHILDIGTGRGSWAVDVADTFPDATVRGVDLFPPPIEWLPPNCILEVDDVLQGWTWQEPFDLVHLRILEGSFTPEEQKRLYAEIYKNIRPGGWIEQLELTPHFVSDDGSLPPDNILADWGQTLINAGNKSGRPFNLFDTCQDHIKEAGFVDREIYLAKWPLGPWPRDKRLKEAGTVNHEHWSIGMEGYGMFLFTKFGDPVPWSKEEVQVYTAKLRNELKNPRFHIYHEAKRVWARKPFPEEEAAAAAAVKKEPKSP
ncbi:hypothetical protein N7509_001149 [Penicillium cosmopolitanum]|uniref:Methyltransferase domain-containing protein n=1 Tax=Penicillium cosmopolitanum TaxID=1131564 RepID=A0A9W9WC23_9EURO|nr:uncharacterized protein N7509_001149 [Penicillium cosmopolitanum]KAJ5414522.1 hypothetical protein N7509_001149 [Penicillium cosmopolitanum]